MFGRKKKLPEDYIGEFRWGYFDKSGYVAPLHQGFTKSELEKLNIPEGTKPFLFPTGKGYIPLFLAGKVPLSKEYSIDGTWLDAELTYSKFEKSGSLSGKMTEYFHRVGEIKTGMGEDFTVRGNLFIIILLMIAGICVSYGIGKLFLFP